MAFIIFPLILPPPSAKIIPLIQKTKSLYIAWHNCHKSLPKSSKYSLGQKIDTAFVDAMEAMAIASFLSQSEKIPCVRLAIRKIDLIKILMMILWEIKAIDNKKYLNLSQPIEEIGRMLGGWHGQITKQNSPDRGRGEK